MTAKQAREITGVDPRTTKEKFIDEVTHYIKMEAENHKRKMTFRIPDRYGNRYLIWDVQHYFEDLGYTVNCNYPDYQDMVVMW